MKKLVSSLFAMILLFTLALPVLAESNSSKKDTSPAAETQTWLNWFDKLTKEDQLKVSYKPAELISFNENALLSLPNVDPLASFAPDTKEWLNWFNSLTEEEQLQVNYRPAEFALLNKTEVTVHENQYNNQTIDSKTNSNDQLTLQALETMPTGGYEHPYSSSAWENLTDKANCYAYMLNTSTYSGHKLQPGELAGKVFTSLTSSSIISASKLDMPYLNKSLRTSTYSEVPGYREYKVALVIAPNYDYHWYRQDADGGWSHKRGLTAIDFRDASGNSIRNPQTADRNYGNGLNYSTWGGWYIIKY